MGIYILGMRTVKNLNESGGASSWDTILRTSSVESDNADSSVRQEVLRYLKEKLESRRSDPLKYWREKQGQYPLVSSLVRKYLCPPPSSAASERAFKTAKYTLGDLRQKMNPENTEMNLFLKYNLRAIGHDIDNLTQPPPNWEAPNSKPAVSQFDEDSESDDSSEEDSAIEINSDDSGSGNEDD